jgi:hypothetical protein
VGAEYTTAPLAGFKQSRMRNIRFQAASRRLCVLIKTRSRQERRLVILGDCRDDWLEIKRDLRKG